MPKASYPKNLPGQKFGNNAVGAAIERQFEEDGKFTGTIVSFRKMGMKNIYTVQYVDGDVEDVDGDEYNVGYALWLQESGWLPEAEDVKPTTLKKQTKVSKAARSRIEDVIDLTAASSITGKHIQHMDATALSAVIATAEKKHRKLENLNVKAAVLEVQYAAMCRDAFVKHLQEKVSTTTAMQHGRRPTVMENQAILARLKIGDWIFATEDMSPGINSEAGYGCIAAVHAKEHTVNAEPTIVSVDIQWLMANRFERHVKVERLTVVMNQNKLTTLCL